MAGGMGGYSGPNLPPVQQMPPMQMPPPMREKRSGPNGCLIGGLAGCGILLIVLVVVGMAGINAAKSGKGGIGKMVTNIMAGEEYVPKMRKVSAALDQYKDDHDGKYPASLSALVPKYMPDKASYTPDSSETNLDYTPPKPDAKPDTAILSVTNGESQILTTRTTIYVRLLKDGSIVQDQVQRTNLRQK